MKLPFLDVFKKKVPSEYFLALLFRDEKIHAVVFEKIQDRIQVIGEGKANLPYSIERSSNESLLDASDKAISFAEQSLPNNITTHKTVFGVKETWVQDSHITKDYLARLKTISEQLDLKPIGFLVFPEAIAHLLQREEGAPVSAILVETGEKNCIITLMRAGRIVDTKEVPIDEEITTTVETALKKFENVEIFPSRIIIFDGSDATVEKKFLTHKWSKTLPFLHVPQITMLPKDFDTRAVLYGTATQMGLDAIDLIKQPVKKHDGVFEEEVRVEKTTSESNSAEANAVKDEEEREETSNVSEPEKSKTSEESMEEVVGDDTSEYFGFVRDADVGEKATPIHVTKLPSDSFDEVTEELTEHEKEEELAGSAPGFSSFGPIFFEGAKNVFAKIKHAMPRSLSAGPLGNTFGQVTNRFPGGKLLFLIPLIILFILIFFIWSIFNIKATVTLFLTSKVISQDASVTFTTSGTTNVAKNTIAAEKVTTDEQGTVNGNATGTKDIGDKAKGKITVFNIDSTSHTFSSGTIVTCTQGCPSQLQFTLDSDVTVASGSSDPTNPSAGQADVNVTASSIGTDYNLPSGAKFSFSGTSSVAAKNSSAFSGGTKKSITVVSQKDLDNLTNQLADTLKGKASSDITNKVDSSMIVLPGFTKNTPGQVNFDKKVGDEANSIILNGTISFETLAYSKVDMQEFAKNALSGQLPQGLTITPNQLQYTVQNVTAGTSGTLVKLTIKASLIPNLDTKSLSNQISGKSFAQAKDILSAVPQYSDSTITLSPNFFFLPKNLPWFSRNIVVTVHE